MAHPSTPLKPTVLHLLLALVDGPSHGYALARSMEEESGGRVRVMPGNLYAVIRRLVDDGWVAEGGAPPEADGGGPRRRYFELTELGREILGAEARRMARIADVVRSRLVEAGAGDGESAS